MRIVQPSFTIERGLNGIEDLKHIERCGRTCYKSEDKITEESALIFVRKIIASGHHSVLEHVSATVRIVCDRGVSHEIVRHRLAAYSQESTRYCNYGAEKHGGKARGVATA
jgi:thymidylate synthase (FAD)